LDKKPDLNLPARYSECLLNSYGYLESLGYNNGEHANKAGRYNAEKDRYIEGQ